jgi:kumamolisin
MNDRKVFTDSVTELPPQPGLTKNGLMVNEAKSENRNERMDVLFSLEMPSKDDLEKRVAAGEVIPVEQLNQKYTPKKLTLTE